MGQGVSSRRPVRSRELTDLTSKVNNSGGLCFVFSLAGESEMRIEAMSKRLRERLSHKLDLYDFDVSFLLTFLSDDEINIAARRILEDHYKRTDSPIKLLLSLDFLMGSEIREVKFSVPIPSLGNVIQVDIGRKYDAVPPLYNSLYYNILKYHKKIDSIQGELKTSSRNATKSRKAWHNLRVVSSQTETNQNHDLRSKIRDIKEKISEQIRWKEKLQEGRYRDPESEFLVFRHALESLKEKEKELRAARENSIERAIEKVEERIERVRNQIRQGRREYRLLGIEIESIQKVMDRQHRLYESLISQPEFVKQLSKIHKLSDKVERLESEIRTIKQYKSIMTMYSNPKTALEDIMNRLMDEVNASLFLKQSIRELENKINLQKSLSFSSLKFLRADDRTTYDAMQHIFGKISRAEDKSRGYKPLSSPIDDDSPGTMHRRAMSVRSLSTYVNEMARPANPRTLEDFIKDDIYLAFFKEYLVTKNKSEYMLYYQDYLLGADLSRMNIPKEALTKYYDRIANMYFRVNSIFYLRDVPSYYIAQVTRAHLDGTLTHATLENVSEHVEKLLEKEVVGFLFSKIYSIMQTRSPGIHTPGIQEAQIKYTSPPGLALNEEFSLGTRARNSWDLSQEMIESIEQILVSHYKFSSQEIDSASVRRSTAFKRFRFLTYELKNLKTGILSRLSDNVQLQFFINIYNCLFFDALITKGAPKDLNEYAKFLNTSRYYVGEHLFSLNDIYCNVLGLSNPGGVLPFRSKKVEQRSYRKKGGHIDKKGSDKYAVARFGKLDPRNSFCLSGLSRRPEVYLALSCLYFENFVFTSFDKDRIQKQLMKNKGRVMAENVTLVRSEKRGTFLRFGKIFMVFTRVMKIRDKKELSSEIEAAIGKFVKGNKFGSEVRYDVKQLLKLRVKDDSSITFPPRIRLNGLGRKKEY